MQVGDFIVILEAGAHHSAFVTSVGASSFNYLPAPASAPSDSVELAKSVTYYPADFGHSAFSQHIYWGGEIRESSSGSRVATLALENFTTGQIPTFNISHEGLSFTEVADAATVSFSPSYDSALPPLALNAVVAQDGVCLDVNDVSFSLESTIATLPSVKSADGLINSRVNARAITGSFNPYKDDTSVSQFTTFNTNALFSLILTAQNSSSTAGEFDLGSCVGFYFPNCLTTEKTVGDQDGILVENLTFSANRGTSGTTDEIFMGFC